MYGMIHTAARELALRKMSANNWKNLKENSGFSESDFITGNSYDDEKTINIIGAIADELKMELPEILIKLGRFWVEYTAQSSFGSVYKMYGKDIFTFLENLNRMHDTIEATLPNTKTPIFECIDRSDDNIDVLYSSHREGLEALVIGLFYGLLDYFKLNGDVRQIESTETGAIFRITLTSL